MTALASFEAAMGDRITRPGDGLCPAHEDRTASLTYSYTGGKLLVNCHVGCRPEDIAAALGQRLSDWFDTPRAAAFHVVATHDYTDDDGRLLFRKERREPKDFRCYRMDSSGARTYSLGDVERVLYNRVGIVKARRECLPVCKAEGEKDADTLARFGLIATCNFDGAAKPGMRAKWGAREAVQLAGLTELVLFWDNDAPGAAHRDAVLHSLCALESPPLVRVMPVLGTAKDVTDWVAAGGTADALAALIAATTLQTPADALAGMQAVDTPALEPSAIAAGFPVQRIGKLFADPELDALPDWILERFFVRGSLNVVYGSGKIGKSTLLAYLAVCVALGVPFAGLETKQGAVLWLDLEQGRSRLARSLRAVPGVDTQNLPLFVHSDLSDRGRSVTTLAATLAEHNFVLVIVDSLGKFAQIEDENDNAAWQRVLQGLEELARSGSAAVVFIDHDRKSEGEHGRGLRGGSSKLAAMDTAVHVKRVPKDDTARLLEVVSRESGSFAMTLTLGPDGYRMGGTRETPADQVELALRANGAMNLDVLTDYMHRQGQGIARSTVQKRLAALTEAGRVAIVSGTGTRGSPHVYGCADLSADSADSILGTIGHNHTGIPIAAAA